MNKYPTVFVHGYIGWGEGDPIADHLGYWGQGKKNILAHLSSEGYEVHAPALGPYTSTWDRSCELYAYLFGGRVDFGKVHSENMAMTGMAQPMRAFSRTSERQRHTRRST